MEKNKRCLKCAAVVPSADQACSACGNTEFTPFRQEQRPNTASKVGTSVSRTTLYVFPTESSVSYCPTCGSKVARVQTQKFQEHIDPPNLTWREICPVCDDADCFMRDCSEKAAVTIEHTFHKGNNASRGNWLATFPNDLCVCERHGQAIRAFSKMHRKALLVSTPFFVIGWLFLAWLMFGLQFDLSKIGESYKPALHIPILVVAIASSVLGAIEFDRTRTYRKRQGLYKRQEYVTVVRVGANPKKDDGVKEDRNTRPDRKSPPGVS